MTDKNIIKWQDVKDLPEGARLQTYKKSKVVSVFFPYHFRDNDGKAKTERDYIGSVKNGKFVPNLFYIQTNPTKAHRDPKLWKNPTRRKKALGQLREEERFLESTDWHELELTANDDITRQIGATALCTQILYEEHLVDDVARTLDYNVEATMHALNLGLHLALTSKASYLAASESETCKFIGYGCQSSQRISEYFSKIGGSLQLSARLMRHRLNSMTQKGDLVAIDGSYLDSNSKKISIAAIGKRKNQTYGPQVNFSLVSNATTGVPLGYRCYSGDTHDAKTLEDMIELWKDAGINEKKLEFLWDRGYYNADRLAELSASGFRFISGAKTGLNIIKKIIDERNHEFYQARNLLEHHYCFGLTEDVALGNKSKAKAYVYFSPNKQMVETRQLQDELKKVQEKWLDGTLNPDDPLLFLFKKPVYGKPLEIDQEQVDQECYIRGFFACLSNSKQSADEVLQKYRTRNEIEVLFRLMMEHLLKTTRVQSTATLEGLLFVVFIALSILSRLRKILQTKVPSKRSVRAANSNILSFDKTYSLDDYVTISEALNEFRGITATVSKRTKKVRLYNATNRKLDLLAQMGYGGLFDDAEAVWKLLSAEHLSDVIKQVKIADEKKRK